MFLENVR